MLKIAIAQMEIRAGRPDINSKKMLQFIDEAKQQGARLIIFPSLAIEGKTIGTITEAFLADCETYTSAVINSSDGIAIVFNNAQNKILIAKDGRLTQTNFGLEVMLAHSRFILGENKKIQPFNKPVIYVNAVGLEDRGKTIYTLDGRSCVYNSKGEIIFRAPAFEEGLYFVELEKIDTMPPIAEEDEPEIANIYKALHYGVKTFLEHIGMKKIVIGVSGGIDSAVDTALYTKILGSENVLLVNMPSVFNSATTRGLSEELANNLGCNYMVVPIQESVDHTVSQLESIPMNYLEKNLNTQLQVSSFAKENIQARDRSSRILATLAAVFGGGFTCNANKAETTVGYATMYGDSAGVLSALADLWKFQVYDLAHYLNDVVYGREVIPQGIIDIVPSAELSNNQNVDQGKGDPMKYPYHDYLFKAFVEKDATPEDILIAYAQDKLEEKIGCKEGLVKKYFANTKEFITDLEYWWKQFTGIAVAKRIQAPPLIAVTNKPFGSERPEAQNGIYYTRAYNILKEELLNK